MNHACTPVVLAYSGGIMVATGERGRRIYASQCKRCLWRVTGDRDEVVRLAADHESGRHPTLFSEAL